MPHDVPKSVLKKLRTLVKNLDTYDSWMTSMFCRLCVSSGSTDEVAIIAPKDLTSPKGGIYCLKHGLIAFKPLSDLRDGVKPLWIDEEKVKSNG